MDVGVLTLADPIHELDLPAEVIRVAADDEVAVQEHTDGALPTAPGQAALGLAAVAPLPGPC